MMGKKSIRFAHSITLGHYPALFLKAAREKVPGVLAMMTEGETSKARGPESSGRYRGGSRRWLPSPLAIIIFGLYLIWELPPDRWLWASLTMLLLVGVVVNFAHPHLDLSHVRF